MRRQYIRTEPLGRASLRAAMPVRGVRKEKGSSGTRLLQGNLVPDGFVFTGQSRAWAGVGANL